jgi:hypothetical protein
MILMVNDWHWGSKIWKTEQKVLRRLPGNIT